uniref:Uncharacterized protein n=1 Tax=Anguilla anguilla TaxID=7936 RepID=A0A0E9PX59_ANGAN
MVPGVLLWTSLKCNPEIVCPIRYDQGQCPGPYCHHQQTLFPTGIGGGGGGVHRKPCIS